MGTNKIDKTKTKYLIRLLVFGIILSAILVMINNKNTSATTEIAIPTEFAHPSMYISASEIADIKDKVNSNQEPWNTAYDKMINDANAGLVVPVQSVTFGGKTPLSGDIHDYYTDYPITSDGILDPNADRRDYSAVLKMDKALRDVAMAYAFTGESRYAEKAIQFIKTWAIDPSTKMNPRFTNYQSRIELSITIPSVFYGADLVWNYPGFDSSDKASLKTWASQLIDSTKTWSGKANVESWRMVLVTSASVIADDSTNLQFALDKWKNLISDQINLDGSLKYELRRTKSLSYSVYALNAEIEVAEIARHHGTDLYNYKLSDGRGLELALDFIAPYVANPSTWPHQQIAPYTGESVSIFELAYSFKQKSSYMNIITTWGRPMYDLKTMGPVTLTHAYANFNIIGPTPVPTVPNPNPTPNPSPTPVPTVPNPNPTPIVTVPNPTPSPLNPQINVRCYKISRRR